MLRLVVEATQWAAVRTWVWSSKEPPQNNPPLLLNATSIRFKWEDFLCIYVRWLRVTMKGNSCGEASTPLTILSWISWPAHHIIWIWSLGIKNRLVERISDLLFVLAVKPTSLLRWWRIGWLWNSCERPSSSLKKLCFQEQVEIKRTSAVCSLLWLWRDWMRLCEVNNKKDGQVIAGKHGLNHSRV